MARGGAAVVAGTLSAVTGLAGCAAAPPVSSPSPSTHAVAPPAPVRDARIAPLLAATWQGYRQRFLQADGRVLDPKRSDATTSEGQSYALLRAAWMDDRATFATVWRWTQDNLGNSAGLFDYLWGRRPDGNWGRLSGDSATDADTDIALALLVAAQRWGMPAYRDAATAVVRAVWASEVAQIGGRPYVVAGPWARSTSPGPTLNPSYLAPYAYRLFAAVDSAHPWRTLVDTSYQALRACTDAGLASGRSAGLPPNWCTLDSAGTAHAATAMPAHDDYGYDAFRTMWRVAVDVVWNSDRRGRDWLQRCSFLRSAWHRDGRLDAVYRHDGGVASADEDVAAYGADLGNLVVTDPQAAQQVVTTKLLPSVAYTAGVPHFADPDNYYQQNWTWFGLALAAGRITPPSTVQES